MADSRDPSRGLEAREGLLQGVVMLVSIIYICKMTAKSFLLLPGGNARGEQPNICFKRLNFLLPVNIQL